jgi:RNA methyltransferase, TrmH family
MPGKTPNNRPGGPKKPSPSGANKPRPTSAMRSPASRAPEPPSEKQPGLLTSPDNDKVRFLRHLQNKKDRYAASHFLVEGVRLVDEALNAPSPPLYTLYDSDALSNTDAGRRLLMRLIELVEDKKGVFPATARIMESISDTVTTQGVAAAVPFVTWEASAFAEARLHVILDELQDPGNLGTIMRSAGGAGSTAVWLTEDSVDLYAPKVVRAGMGAHFRVPTAHSLNWPALQERLKALGVEQILLAEGEADAESNTRPRKTLNLPELTYYEVDWKKPSAVIVGNEAHGLSAEAWQAATAVLRIPMPGGAESLNAAVAASLIIFEALRQRTN